MKSSDVISFETMNNYLINEDKNKNDINYFTYLKYFLSVLSLIVYIIDIYYIYSSSKINQTILEKFYPVIPSFVRPNSDGYFEINKNCLREIPIYNINFKNEEKCFIQEIESKQMGNIAGNIDSSNLLNIAIIHSDANFNSQINKLIENSKKYTSFVVKYILGFMNINIEDIKLSISFMKDIEYISNENHFSDEQKAIELDKLFKNCGYFIPQKIYLGGSFIIENQDINAIDKNNSMYLSGKIDITDKFKFNKTNKNTYENIISILNKVQKTNIIGGNKNAENFESWKKSINEDNIEVIGYENLIEITSIFSNQLKSNLKKPLELLEKKYNLRKKYYDIIADLKERIKIKKFGISSSLSEGICNIENELIYSKRINIKEKLDFFDNNFNLQYSFSDIIIGWKIDSFESLNRELNVVNSPILQKEINFNFIRSFDIFETGYNIEIFFMKYPE